MKYYYAFSEYGEQPCICGPFSEKNARDLEMARDYDRVNNPEGGFIFAFFIDGSGAAVND